jgi:hypothetical protein
MKKYFIIFLLIHSVSFHDYAQGYYLVHHQLAMGADTSEIYLCTYWYPKYDSLNETILHSMNNGLDFSIRHSRFIYYLPGAPGALFSDSTAGVVYWPNYALDTFAVSFDTGMTMTRKYFHDPGNPASGCLSGEIYFQIYLPGGSYLCRSRDYGTSFDTIPINDSLVLVDVGANPGELYFVGYGNDTIINVVTSLDYGITYQSHKIHVPYYITYDLRHGASPGEFYLLVYDSPGDYFYIYHAMDYGNNVTFQQTHEICGGFFKSYTAGRKPGTFYVARRSTYDPTLYIDYSTDYGVTFTTYTHYLDSSYTGIVNKDLPLNIKLFPNPVSTQLNIELPKDNPYLNLQLLNFLGQVCLEQDIKPGSEKVEIGIPKLEKGIYFLRLKTRDNQSLIRKVAVN